MRSRKIAGSGRSISGLFVFLLLGLYAVFSLLLVLIGAGVYQGIANDADHNAQMRTSLSYIASKVRANDEAGAVSVEYVEGAPVLVLDQWLDGELFRTHIYYLEDEDGPGGALYELSRMDDGEAPDLAEGERIADVSAFDAQEIDGGVNMSVALRDGSEHSMRLRLRAAR